MPLKLFKSKLMILYFYFMIKSERREIKKRIFKNWL
ncbi:hypothetical protein I656_00121 [Geobacillus sp. WSUCF1]|nr:hypothetical protein I656_00121 [Geobacillus sp. WSUCF1]